MIKEKEVEVKITGSNYKWYRDKGYKLEKEKFIRSNGSADWKYKPIMVKIEDLSPCSTVRVEAICDNCGKHKSLKYNDYNCSIKRCGEYFCKDCSKYHRMKTCEERYGVPNAMQNKEIRDKAIKVMNSRTPEEKEAINQKKIETSRKHYGTDYPMQSKGFREQMTQTNILRYNVPHAMQNPIIRERASRKMMKKYGATYSSQVPEIRKKIAEASFQNQTIRTSRQQRYIADLYGGKLNEVVGYYNVDILLRNDGIVCEYDGKGHDLRVTLNYCSQEEFDQHEIVRDKLIKQEGYKIIKIISSTDKLPSDDILLQMLELSKQYFKDYPNHTWIEWRIDEGTYRNAEEPEGSFFYGPLRKIKDEDLVIHDSEAVV